MWAGGFVCLWSCRSAPVHSNIKEHTHEAHISAKPSRSRAPPRFSCSHRHGWWSQHPACAPRSRPEEIVGLTQRRSGSAVAGDRNAEPDAPLAGTLSLAIIRKRADFVAANHGVRVARPGFVLLVKPGAGTVVAGDAVASGGAKPDRARFGVTVTRKIGNAVARNRMKRRFRALLRDILSHQGVAGADHVLIGREGGIERDFAKLRAELEAALTRIAAGKGDPPRRPRQSGKSQSGQSQSGQSR